MVPRQKRLVRAQFPLVLNEGRRVTSKHFSAAISSKTAGYAVVVPKKLIRKATERHQIKRKLFEILRASKHPFAVIVFLRTAVHGVHYQEMKAEIEKLLASITHL